MTALSKPSYVAAYRKALQRNGQPVTFVRDAGVAPGISQVSATVQAHVMNYVPDTNVVGRTDFGQRLGTITQGDRKIIVLADDLSAAGFPIPLRKHDKAVVQGETLDIIEVDDNTRMLAGAYELVVAGV